MAIAIEKGNLSIVKMLLDKNAKPNVPGMEGGELLTTSVSKGYDQISKELTDAGAHTLSLLAFPQKNTGQQLEMQSPLGKSPVLLLKSFLM